MWEVCVKKCGKLVGENVEVTRKNVGSVERNF